MIPTVFQVGPIPIHSFGLMLVLCFLAGMRRLEISLEKNNLDKKHAEQLVFWSAVGGILGARGLHILGNFQQFLEDPAAMIFTGAGFIFYGGLVGGFLAALIYIKKEGLSFWQMSDLIGPTLALGYAIGRIGCHLSGDGDYGTPTDLPWAVNYALGVVPTTADVHPAPIYESLSAFIICAILLRIERIGALAKAGQRTGLYLLLMSIERYLVEIVRIEPVVSYSLTQAQIFSIVFSIVGFILLAGILRLPAYSKA